MKYKHIYMRWTNNNGYSTLSLHNKSAQEAMDTAQCFGYKPPKWYQFWRSKIIIRLDGFSEENNSVKGE